MSHVPAGDLGVDVKYLGAGARYDEWRSTVRYGEWLEMVRQQGFTP